MSKPGFDVVCVPIGRYDRHPVLDADEEATRVAELLGELGGQPVAWPLPPDAPRTSIVVKERLEAWANQEDARSSVLFWVGHGESSEDGAWLATAETPEAVRLGGFLPGNIAEYVTAEWKYRWHAEDKWAIVVIEACGAERFAELLFSALLANPRPPHRFAVIGAGASDGPGTLGDFSRALDTVLTKGYTDCDDAILLTDLVTRVEQHLPLGIALPSKLHLVPPITRTRKLPAAVSATMDVYAELQRYVATLSDDEKHHFLPKARGADQVEQGEPVWYFVGREEERAEIAAWLRRNDVGLLAVSGRAGSGKSALLGNVLVHSTPTLRDLLTEAGLLSPAPPGEFTDDVRFDTVLHLTGTTVDDVLTRLAEAIGLDLSVDAPGEAVDRLAEALERREGTFTVLADALDESQDPLTIASALLQRISDLPGVRVVVGTRASTSEGPDLPEPDDQDLLAALGDPDVLVVNRDADATARYVRLRLAAALDADDQALDRVATLIRERDQHFLYARLAVHEFIANPALLDHPEDLLRGDHRSLFAATVTRLAARSPAARPLLTALALGLGRGLPRTQGIWRTVAAGLADGAPVSDVDIDDVLSAAAPHIMVDREHGQSVYRLAHRTFAEHFADVATPAHHRRIAEDLATAAADALPEPPNPYVVHHLAAHAGAAQAWDVPAAHPDVLDHLDPDAVAAEVLRTAFGRTDLPPEIAATVSAQRRLAAEPPRWRAVVRAIAMARLADPATPPPALHDPSGSNSVGTASSTTGETTRSSLVVASKEIRAHLRMLGLASPPGHPRSFCSPRDVEGGGVAWARLPTEPVHVVLQAHEGGAYALAALPLSDGRTLLATGGRDAKVRLWDPLTAVPVGAPLTGHENSVFAVAAVPVPGGETLLASAGADGTVRLWDPLTGMPAAPPLHGHDGHVTALAAAPAPDGRVLVASGGEDGRVRLWDPVTHDAIVSEPLGGPVSSIAVVRGAGGEVLLMVGSPGRTLCSLAVDGSVVTPSQEARTSPLPLVASLPNADGTTTQCSVGKWVTATLALHGLPDGGGRSWTLRGTMGDTNDPNALTAFRDENGALVVLTGAVDGAIRVWRPDDEDGTLDQHGETLTGHEDVVHALAALPHPSGGTVVASASADGTVRLWKPDLDDVAPPSDSDIPSGDAVAVTAMALLPWPDGDPLLVTACLDQAVRLWYPRSGTLAFTNELGGQPGDAMWLPGHMAVAAAQLPGGDIRMATGSGHVVGIARRDGNSLRQTYATICRMPWHWRRSQKDDKLAEDVISRRVAKFSPIVAMTTVRVPDGRTLLVVAGGNRLRFLDFDSGRLLSTVVTCGSPVHCVTTVPVGDRTLVAWGEEDGFVRLCDPASGAAVGAPLAGGDGAIHAVTALPTAEGTWLAVGTAEGTVIVLDPADGASVGRIAEAHHGGVRALVAAETADDTYLATGGDDRRLGLYSMTSDDEFSVPVEMPISSLLYWDGGIFVGSLHGLLCVRV